MGYINDDLAWHTVGNPGETRAVTLHFYSPSIDAWLDRELSPDGAS